MTTAGSAVAGQLLGLLVALAGLYLLVGLPWTLIAAGIAIAAFCAVTEAGNLRGKAPAGSVRE